MINNEANVVYAGALKAGRDCYKERVTKGEYPFLPALDEIITDRFSLGYVEVGLIEAPLEAVVGTVSAGRRDAFAANFMPLLPPRSEFGAKWTALCAESLGDEGIKEPVKCFEYLGRFYVEEGNKRVSVLKALGAATVASRVTRLVPPWADDEETAIYYEFMEFHRLSGLYAIRLEGRGSYGRLQAALGFDPGHVWSEEERRSVVSVFSKFTAAGGDGDLFLTALKMYGFEELRAMAPGELEKTVAALKKSGAPAGIDVSTTPGEAKGGVITKILGAVVTPSHLSVAFINDLPPDESPWVASHMLGARRLEEAFGEKVDVSVYNGERGEVDGLFDEAARRGADVIFATTPTQINSCRRAAVKYPSVKILNCSLSMPFPGVRTYYSRIYEGKFVSGAVAGAMTKTGRIGYVASNPIFGVPAGINAFALGASLTCPEAKVVLRWSSCTVDAFSELRAEGCDMISNRDVPTSAMRQDEYGLLRLESDGSLTPIISPVWNWGEIYVRIIGQIFSGAWESEGARGGAINYWWGMSVGAVDMRTAQALPESMARLAEFLVRSVADYSISPFSGHIVTQDGRTVCDGDRWLSPEEILAMDYLVSNVEGSIPSFDELLPIARPIVRIQGIYRDSIPPDKDEMQI